MNLKNVLLTLGLLILFVGKNSAQEADSLAKLYQNYLELHQSNQAMTEKLNELNLSISKVGTQLGKVSELDGRVKNLNNSLNTNLEKVNRLTEIDIFTKKARLEAQKDKIVNTSTFVGASIVSFNAIDQAFAQTDYMTDISSLNNPNNTELGFSLSKEILQLLKKRIIKGNRKFNGKNAKKFLDIAKNIIEDPFVSAFTSSVPGLSAIEGVLNLVSNVIVKEHNTTVDDYKQFKTEMEKFINHYNGLAKAETNLTSNLGNLEMRLEALRTVINNYTRERVREIYPEADFTGMNLNQIVATYYQPLKVENNMNYIFNEYNKNGEIDYTLVLNDDRLEYPFYAINQAQFIKQELEALHNEYISSFQNFHKTIKDVLENSKSLSEDKGISIDKKLNELDEKLDRSIATFETSVSISVVNIALNDIPTY